MSVWRAVVRMGRRKRVLMRCFTWLTSWMLRSLYVTLRPSYVQQHFADAVGHGEAPVVVAFWHGRLLYLLWLYRRQRATVLVSHSRDGEFVSQILACFGLQPTRGSTSHGGRRGLLEMVKKVRQGYIVGFTPDGPRGPRYQAQAGIVMVAKRTGAAILPVAYSARWQKVLRTWDRFVVPLPFSRVVVVYGKPIYVPARASTGTVRAKRHEVETSLRRITEVADHYFQA